MSWLTEIWLVMRLLIAFVTCFQTYYALCKIASPSLLLDEWSREAFRKLFLATLAVQSWVSWHAGVTAGLSADGLRRVLSISFQRQMIQWKWLLAGSMQAAESSWKTPVKESRGISIYALDCKSCRSAVLMDPVLFNNPSSRRRYYSKSVTFCRKYPKHSTKEGQTQRVRRKHKPQGEDDGP